MFVILQLKTVADGKPLFYFKGLAEDEKELDEMLNDKFKIPVSRGKIYAIEGELTQLKPRYIFDKAAVTVDDIIKNEQVQPK